MTDLLDAFRPHLAALGLPRGRVLVAVSGGPDSVALLDLLVRSRDDSHLELIVAHMDHGIHPGSGEVAGRTAALAREQGLEAVIRTLALGPSATETEAREHRYAWLEETRRQLGANYVLTAHHADDQAETVLLRVLAGSGTAGLAAMQPLQGRVARPLLGFTRAELRQYVEFRCLPVWDDPANTDLVHLRSWVRGKILPAIRERVPEVNANLLRLADSAAGDRKAWNAVLDVLPELALRVEKDGISVAVDVLTRYDSFLAAALLRAAARRAGCILGGARSQRAVAFLGTGRSGDRIDLGGGWILEIAFGRACVAHPVSGGGQAEGVVVGGEGGQTQWGDWSFAWRPEVAPEPHPRDGLTAWFMAAGLSVRTWRPGDRVRPVRGAGSRLVVKCFQEARVPRHLRAGWPVVVGRDDEVLWIPGVCRSDVHLPARGAEALRVDAAFS